MSSTTKLEADPGKLPHWDDESDDDEYEHKYDAPPLLRYKWKMPDPPPSERPPPPRTRTITNPVMCRLRTFVRHLAGRLSEDDANSVLDLNREWDGVAPLTEDTLDAFVMDRVQRGRYAVAFVLFHLQNRECFSQCRLWHVVQSRTLTQCFLGMVEIAARMGRGEAHADDDVRMAQRVREWESFGTDAPLVPVEAFDHTPRASATHQTHAIADIVRDAMHRPNSKKRVAQSEVDAALETAFVATGGDLASLTDKRHARIQLAHLVTMLLVAKRAPVRTGKRRMADIEAQRDTAVRWLRRFVLRGCACVA